MITSVNATRLEPGLWLLEWTSDLESPVFYLWQDGVFLFSTGAASAQVPTQVPSSPVFSVLDDPDVAPVNVFPASVVLQWQRPVDLAVLEYLVEEFVAAAWVERARIKAEADLWQYSFRSRALEDVTTHQFRVTPLGVNGNAGTPREYSVFMVRNPDPPAVEYSYDPDTKEITVSAPT